MLDTSHPTNGFDVLHLDSIGNSTTISGLANSQQRETNSSLGSSLHAAELLNLNLENSNETAQISSSSDQDDPLKIIHTPVVSKAKKTDSGSRTLGDGVLTAEANGQGTSDGLLSGIKAQKKEERTSDSGSLETAQNIKLTNHTRTWEGSVGGADQVNLYRVNLATDRNFNLKLKSTRKNTDVVLLDSSGQVVSESSCSCNGRPKVIKTVLDAGTYYVQVTGKGSDASYELSMSRDPGSSRRTAQPLSLTANSQAVKNDLSVTDKADWYRFDLATASQLDLQMKGLKDNANVVLLDQSGAVIQASSQSGRKPEAISDALEAGTYYVKVFGQKCETPYQLTLSATDRTRTLPDDELNAGIFTVGESGEVSIDYLLDGSNLQGELAIFNLKGMERFGVGSERWIQEAAFRAMGNSPGSGYTVILDKTEGARFDGSPGEPDFNEGEYLGAKTFSMTPGDQFAIMLVPNGTVPDVISGSDLSVDQRPLFSMPSANFWKTTQFAEALEVRSEGSNQIESTVISVEDTQLDNGSDRDYDDLVFQIKGATGQVKSLDEVIDPVKEWRGAEQGQQVAQFVTDPLDPAGNTVDAARRVNVASNGKIYSGWVGGIDTDDFYSISLGALNQFSLFLDGLTADANVELLDANGKLIQSSNNTDTTAEVIDNTLNAGAYRLRVTSAENVGTSFNLKLSVTPLIEGVESITTTGSEEEGELFTVQSLPLIEVPNFRSGDSSLGSDPRFTGISGRGFSTVILDTGIIRNHPFFGADANIDGIADRINFSFDYADHDDNATDDDGHGTNVASIAAGGRSFIDPATGRTVNYSGVAPEANIISLKVFRDGIDTYRWGDLEQALQWVVDNAERFNIASINMSLGSGNYNTPQSLFGIDDELAALVARGVIVVSASGNDFFENSSAQGVSYPSADRNSLSIGAIYDANVGRRFYPTDDPSDPPTNGPTDTTTAADRITSFSQRHSTLTTIFAPGARITGAGRDTFPGNPDFASIYSGTSQAAPHIAGMAVLAQQLAQQVLNRRLTPAEFRQLLVSTGDILTDGDDENDNVTNTGLQFRRANMLALGNAILDLRPPSDRRIDLSASNFDVVQQTFNAGDSIDLNFQIQNTETDNSYPFDVNFYLSDNSDITQNDYFLGSYRISRLGGNSNTGLLPYQLSLPDASDPIWNSFKSGNAYIGMIVDGLNAVGETNENNNITSDRLQGRLTVTINRLTGDFDPPFNSSDFYTLVSFSENPPDDENLWWKSPIETGNDIRPTNWKSSQIVDSSTVPITIRVYEDDELLTFANDQIDVDPALGNTALNLVYDFLTGTISGDVNGVAGQVLGSTGSGRDNSGSIEFTVSFDPTAQ